MGVIQHETTRLGRLIENVLTFARSGKPRPMRQVIVGNIDALIESVLATFQPQLAECHMTVERKYGSIPPLSLDREAFEQILVNLISNAIKYAAAGRLIRIETAYTSDQLRLQVADNGPGIAPRLRRRVFEPFIRGSNRLEDPAGTGIGLSIARQLARQHGGDCQLLPSPQGVPVRGADQGAGRLVSWMRADFQATPVPAAFSANLAHVFDGGKCVLHPKRRFS